MSARYTRTAIALHWTIFALMVVVYAFGWIMTDMAISPLKLRMFSWHKWVGITILALLFVRLAWRFGHPPPPPVPMPAIQRLAAHAVHGLLYLMLLVQPLTGWAYSNASGYPVVYLGLLPLPNLLAKDTALAKQLEQVHELAGWVLFAAIAVHVAAAVKHHVFDRDDTLRRMLPWRTAVGGN